MWRDLRAEVEAEFGQYEDEAQTVVEDVLASREARRLAMRAEAARDRRAAAKSKAERKKKREQSKPHAAASKEKPSAVAKPAVAPKLAVVPLKPPPRIAVLPSVTELTDQVLALCALELKRRAEEFRARQQKLVGALEAIR